MSIYRYDAFNRLTKYNSGSAEASYTYNANNLRASKTVNRETTGFVWNGQNLAAENKADTINTYTYDITGVHIANRNGNVTSYLKDYHGNIVGTTTVAGAMVEEKTGQMDYDAFGNRWQGDTPDPFGYCGEYLDNESGLIYLRNRYYDSEIGRFITEDPAHDGLNWYSYCSSDPINFKDFSGFTEYYVNGPFPKFTFDHTFPYNPNAVATQDDYDSWNHWNNMAWGSGFAPWLKDASKSYKHYLDNTGTDLWVDYERAYKEDKVIKSHIDSQIDTMKNAVKWLYDNGWGTSFNITGEMFDVPNGNSENWQKTIGAHQVFGVGGVTINTKTGKATMKVTFYMEDMYNFNPGMSDIASGTPDDVNGRFSELGWAREFKSYGSLTKTITWKLFNPPKNSNGKGANSR